jgi:hypothetical protein
MTSGRNKYQSRENRARVRAILWQEWDPIGINDLEDAEDDQYDAYADKAYVMLTDQGATAKEIADYLFAVATEHMALKDRARQFELSDKVARLLVSLRPEFGLH